MIELFSTFTHAVVILNIYFVEEMIVLRYQNFSFRLNWIWTRLLHKVVHSFLWLNFSRLLMLYRYYHSFIVTANVF